MKRQEGFYWVVLREMKIPIWIPAHFAGGAWFLPGIRQSFTGRKLRVGERIPDPPLPDAKKFRKQ